MLTNKQKIVKMKGLILIQRKHSCVNDADCSSLHDAALVTFNDITKVCIDHDLIDFLVYKHKHAAEFFQTKKIWNKVQQRQKLD